MNPFYEMIFEFWHVRLQMPGGPPPTLDETQPSEFVEIMDSDAEDDLVEVLQLKHNPYMMDSPIFTSPPGKHKTEPCETAAVEVEAPVKVQEEEPKEIESPIKKESPSDVPTEMNYSSADELSSQEKSSSQGFVEHQHPAVYIKAEPKNETADCSSKGFAANSMTKQEIERRIGNLKQLWL